MNRLADTALIGGERSDASDHCLAGITRLAAEVKDASNYLPSYDQRTYAEVWTAQPLLSQYPSLPDPHPLGHQSPAGEARRVQEAARSQTQVLLQISPQEPFCSLIKRCRRVGRSETSRHPWLLVSRFSRFPESLIPQYSWLCPYSSQREILLLRSNIIKHWRCP